MKFIYVTSGDEDVLHDGDEDGPLAPSLAYARREGKEKKSLV